MQIFNSNFPKLATIVCEVKSETPFLDFSCILLVCPVPTYHFQNEIVMDKIESIHNTD